MQSSPEPLDTSLCLRRQSINALNFQGLERIPGTRRSKVAAETLRDWLQAWRKGGFPSLPAHVADLMCCIKDEHPNFTVGMVIDVARQRGTDALVRAPSTVHRLLSRRGLMHKPAGDPTSKDRRRFAFERAGELWVSDVMHAVPIEGEGRRKHKTYLLAMLDDATPGW